MTKPKGFTLVELLIVVAILVMLVGMLLSVLTRIRDRDMDAVCRNNLMSLWVPMRFYAEDHEGFLPPVQHESHGSWNQLLANYGKDQSGWSPPMAYTPKENFDCPSYEYDISRRGCYGMNWAMANHDTAGQGIYIRGTWPNLAYMLPATIRPSKMYLVGDTSRWKPTGDHQSSFLRLSVSSTPVFRHAGHCNVLFHDGHVEPIEDKEIPLQVYCYLPWFNREDHFR